MKISTLLSEFSMTKKEMDSSSKKSVKTSKCEKFSRATHIIDDKNSNHSLKSVTLDGLMLHIFIFSPTKHLS